MTEVRGERIGLDRRARFAREDVKRSFDGSSPPHGPRPDRSSRGHLEARPSRLHCRGRAQDFGREARSAHPEQNDVREAVAPHAVARSCRAGRSIRPSARGESSHPSRLANLLLNGRIVAPGGRIAAPQAWSAHASSRWPAARLDGVAKWTRRKIRSCLRRIGPCRWSSQGAGTPREQVVLARHDGRILYVRQRVNLRRYGRGSCSALGCWWLRKLRLERARDRSH